MRCRARGAWRATACGGGERGRAKFDGSGDDVGFVGAHALKVDQAITAIVGAVGSKDLFAVFPKTCFVETAIARLALAAPRVSFF